MLVKKAIGQKNVVKQAGAELGQAQFSYKLEL